MEETLQIISSISNELRGWIVKLVKSTLKRFPAFHALDRYFCYRYTNSYEREKYPRGHFYSPLPDIREVESCDDRAVFRPDTDLGPSIDLNFEGQKSILAELALFHKQFMSFEHPSSEHRFHLKQTVFCHGDALILHAILRNLRPKHVIEIGSGFSSALMLDTNESFLGSEIQFMFVEPFPKRLLSLLTDDDRKQVQLVKDNAQNVPISVFQKLEANDILFVDSSHVSKYGSDVNFIIFNILPALKPGVVIHFHDIFWPFEYPKKWILDKIAWNEAYLLRAFLQYNRHFKILLFNNFVGWAYRSFFEEHMPIFLKNIGGFIMVKKSVMMWPRKLKVTRGWYSFLRAGSVTPYPMVDYLLLDIFFNSS